MNERYVADTIHHMKARRTMLENRLHEMNNRILGRDNSFLPFISNKSGKVSERKIAIFINELMNGVLDRYEHEKYKEMCRCFLYCTIKGIAEYNECEKYPVRNACYFSDIADMAQHKNNLHLTDMDTLYDYEYRASMYDSVPGERTYWSEFNDGGFFRNSDLAFLLLTGKHIVSSFLEEKYREISHAIELENAKANGFDTVEEYQEYLGRSSLSIMEESDRLSSEELPEDTDYVSIDDWEENNTDTITKQTEKIKEWVQSFSSPDTFVQKYLRFRELFFELGMYYRCHLFEDILLMTDVFLYEHGLSCLSENDSFAMIYYRTSKLCAAVKHEAVRRVNR